MSLRNERITTKSWCHFALSGKSRNLAILLKHSIPWSAILSNLIVKEMDIFHLDSEQLQSQSEDWVIFCVPLLDLRWQNDSNRACM